MRRKFLSCAVAGALALSTPLAAGMALADDGQPGSQNASQTEGKSLQDRIERFKELHRKLDAGVTAEEKVAIDWELKLLEEELKAAGVDVEGIVGTAQDGAGGVSDPSEGEVPENAETDDPAADGDLVDEDTAGSAEDPAEDAEDPESSEGTDEDETGDEAVDPEGPDGEDPSDTENPDGEDGGEQDGEGEGPEGPEAEPAPEEPSVPEQQPETPAVPEAPATPAPPAAKPSLPLVPNVSFDSGKVPVYDYSADMDTEKFIALIGEQARAIAQENDLYASVMIAQAILESGSGKSKLAQAPNNNLFGIKGAWEDEDGKKHSVSFLTSEDDGTGSLYQIVSSFRAYGTVSDSLEDYASLLREDMAFYYHGAWKEFADTYEDAAKFLEGRYATDTHYAEKLVGIIEAYGLDRYDEALDWEPIDEEVEIKDLLAEATSHIGTPYVWGGNSPLTGFDCSGLIQWSYREALGIELTRTTYTQCLEGNVVKFDDLHPGDLLFFEDGGDIHHVALYLGDGFYLHAPQTGEVVKVTSMEEYEPDFAVRVVQTKPVDGEGEPTPTPWTFRGLIWSPM